VTTDRPDVTDPAPVDDTAVSRGQIAQAYTTIFGLQASSTTIDCIAGELDADPATADGVAGWLDGTQLDAAGAQEIFTPFVACAPEDDFVSQMIAAATQIVGAAADEGCIGDLAAALSTDGRAEAIALAYADRQQFQDRMYSTFAQCAG
jgi:hypothetical protein